MRYGVRNFQGCSSFSSFIEQSRSNNYENTQNDPSNGGAWQPSSSAGSPTKEDIVSASIDIGSLASIAAQFGGDGMLKAGLKAVPTATASPTATSTSSPSSTWSDSKAPSPSSSPTSSSPSSDYSGKATFFTRTLLFFLQRLPLKKFRADSESIIFRRRRCSRSVRNSPQRQRSDRRARQCSLRS